MSTVLEAQSSKKWYRLLPQVIEGLNNRPARGTSFRRNDVTKNNFLDYMDELTSLKNGGKKVDSTLTFNSRSIDFQSLSKRHSSKLFAFPPDTEVIATKNSLRTFAEGEKGAGSFSKASVEGAFSKRVYVVKQAKLRETAKGSLVQGRTRRQSFFPPHSCFCSFHYFSV